jgi:uncharacterized protein YndB with AHSA1/START domain
VSFTLELARTLPAARATVFAAFADAGTLARWWGPEGFTIPALDFEPRVGARYRIAMRPPGGEPFHLTGEFTAVEPPARLAFTFTWEPPDPDDVTTAVDVTLRDAGGESCALVVTQTGFTTEARRALHHDGWSESLGKLARVVAA